MTEIPVVNQIELNPYLYDEDIIETCKKYQILIQAHSPLGSGGMGLQEEGDGIKLCKLL